MVYQICSLIKYYFLLPDRVRGKLSTFPTNLNAAIGPITSRMRFINSTDNLAVVLSTPSLVTYKHSGTCPFVGSGTPKTATSAISGCLLSNKKIMF